MDVGNIDEREAFTTLDGSTIREIAGRMTLPSLCCCAPPYSHEDTVLTEEPRPAP